MSNALEAATNEGQSDKARPGCGDGSPNEASKNCLAEVNASLQAPANQSDAKFNAAATDSTNATPQKVERSDIKNGLFDENAPLSHFTTVVDGVYRSGRPIGEDGIKEGVEKIWGDSQFDPAHAQKTSIVNLVGFDKGKYFQITEDEVSAELENATNLGVTDRRFPMQTHDVQDPAYIQSILDYIDEQKADGNKVLIHCFHGTDRTGTISAAYLLTHDPQLEQLVRDNPQEAFKQGLKNMTDNGFTQQLMPELTQSLQDFVNWKHTQLVQQHADRVNTTDATAADATVAQQLEITPLWS